LTGSFDAMTTPAAPATSVAPETPEAPPAAPPPRRQDENMSAAKQAQAIAKHLAALPVLANRHLGRRSARYPNR
jgi:hypothetical protein